MTYEQRPKNQRLEIQLLIACARTDLDSESSSRIDSLVRSNIDWSYTCQLAHQHGVMPLLYWNLRSYAIPQQVRDCLQRSFSANAEFNLLRTREMLALLSLFESQGIPTLSFKGPLLAQVAYANIALRQFNDLDILVQKRHLNQAREALLARGYKLGVELSRLQQRFPILSRRKDDILVDATRKIVVELHFQLSGNHFRFPLSLEQLLPRLETTQVGGKAVRCFPAEDLLSYLCLHGSRHCWERLLWIVDVAELTKSHPQLNWELVGAQAKSLGGQRTVALGLLLARDLLGTRIPDDVWKKLQLEPATEFLAKRLGQSLFNGADKGLSYWHEYHMLMRERRADRLRLRLHYLRRYARVALVPNERDHAIMELPKRLSFFYYPLRSFRLLTEFSVSGFNKLLRKNQIRHDLK